MTPSAPLNVFQRVIRQWERVHPYNAAQVMKLAGPVDERQAAAAWDEALTTLGLGPVWVNRWRYGFDVRPAASDGALSAPAADLQQHITAEMNRPFADGELPFRPFVLRAASEDAHHAGVVYRHWVADSVSIQMLMRQWFALMHHPGLARRRGVRLAAGGYWRHFGPERAGWDLFRWMGRAPADAWGFACSKRLRTRGSHEHRVRFLIRHAPAGMIDRLRGFAHESNATVSDLFLAAMAVACPPALPFQDRPRRSEIGLGTIVDLRPLSRDDLSDRFGLFLGFANVRCRAPDLEHPWKLLREIARQTRHNKQRAAACTAQIWLAAGLTARLFRPVHKFYQYYRKYMPLCGGLSNVNLNGTWMADHHPHPLLDYLRISPTGPTVPAVFTTTTLGSGFHLALAYRESIIPEAAAASMADGFFKTLDSFPTGLADPVAAV